MATPSHRALDAEVSGGGCPGPSSSRLAALPVESSMFTALQGPDGHPSAQASGRAPGSGKAPFTNGGQIRGRSPLDRLRIFKKVDDAAWIRSRIEPRRMQRHLFLLRLSSPSKYDRALSNPRREPSFRHFIKTLSVRHLPDQARFNHRRVWVALGKRIVVSLIAFRNYRHRRSGRAGQKTRHTCNSSLFIDGDAAPHEGYSTR